MARRMGWPRPRRSGACELEICGSGLDYHRGKESTALKLYFRRLPLYGIWCSTPKLMQPIACSSYSSSSPICHVLSGNTLVLSKSHSQSSSWGGGLAPLACGQKQLWSSLVTDRIRDEYTIGSAALDRPSLMTALAVQPSTVCSDHDIDHIFRTFWQRVSSLSLLFHT
jgi:hypothetical protein